MASVLKSASCCTPTYKLLDDKFTRLNSARQTWDRQRDGINVCKKGFILCRFDHFFVSRKVVRRFLEDVKTCSNRRYNTLLTTNLDSLTRTEGTKVKLSASLRHFIIVSVCVSYSEGLRPSDWLPF